MQYKVTIAGKDLVKHEGPKGDALLYVFQRLKEAGAPFESRDEGDSVVFDLPPGNLMTRYDHPSDSSIWIFETEDA